MIDSYPPPPTPEPQQVEKRTRRMPDFERCDYCGRFMKHIWYLDGDEPDAWVDYWSCVKWEQHKQDHPEDWF